MCIRDRFGSALTSVRENLANVGQTFGSQGLIAGLQSIPSALGPIAGVVTAIAGAVVGLDSAIRDIRASNEQLRSLGVADPRRAREFQRDVLQRRVGVDEQRAQEIVQQYIRTVGADRFNQGSNAAVTRDLLALNRLYDVEPTDSERLARLERAFGQGNLAEAVRSSVFVNQQGGLAPEILDSFVEDAGRFRGAGFTNQQILASQLAAARTTDISAQDLNVVYDQTFVRLAEEAELRQRLGISDFSRASERFGGDVQSLIRAVALAQGEDTTAEQRLYLERTTGENAEAFNRAFSSQLRRLSEFELPQFQNRQGFFGQLRTQFTTDIADFFERPSFDALNRLIQGRQAARRERVSPISPPIRVEVEVRDATDAGIAAQTIQSDAYAAFGLPTTGPESGGPE